MRRSFWFATVLAVALGTGVLDRAEADSLNLLPPPGNPGEILSGSVNSAPFLDPSHPEQVNSADKTKKEQGTPGARSSLPSVSPLPRGGSFPGVPENSSSTYGRHRSLGSLFELKRQETLLKREIAIKKLKDQLKGPPVKKILDTGTHGAPMTLLAAGIDGNRYAILEWNDGRRIRVRQGENLPDGTRVIRIDGSGVSVNKRGKTVTYPYGESSKGRPDGSPSRFSGFSPPPLPSPMTGGRP